MPRTTRRYVFLCVDVFSCYIWVRALRNKEAATTKNAMREILDEIRGAPLNLKVFMMKADDGSEWKNVFRIFIENQGIILRTNSRYPATTAENRNRTLRRLLDIRLRTFKMANGKPSRNYLPFLQKCAAAMNTSKSRAIHNGRLSPKDIVRSEITNNTEVSRTRKGDFQKRLLQHYPAPPSGNILVGDLVRYAIAKEVNKGLRPVGYKQAHGKWWSARVYTVLSIRKGDRVIGNRYKLTNNKFYYRNEILKSAREDLISKRLTTRDIGRHLIGALPPAQLPPGGPDLAHIPPPARDRPVRRAPLPPGQVVRRSERVRPPIRPPGLLVGGVPPPPD